jgi:hypothetical protein
MRVRSFLIPTVLATGGLAKFQYIGVNEAGPEFGESKLPGVKNKDVIQD